MEKISRTKIVDLLKRGRFWRYGQREGLGSYPQR